MNPRTQREIASRETKLIHHPRAGTTLAPRKGNKNKGRQQPPFNVRATIQDTDTDKKKGHSSASPCAIEVKAPSFDDFWSEVAYLEECGKDAASSKPFGRQITETADRSNCQSRPPGRGSLSRDQGAGRLTLTFTQLGMARGTSGWQDESKPEWSPLSPEAANGQPAQHNHQLSRADATSLGFDVVARTRRASSEPLF